MITLDNFHPRPYQRDFFDAMENSQGKYRNAIIVHPRRSGKDYMALQYAVRFCVRKTTTVLYYLSTYSQAKDVIWDAISHDGVRFLDTIPKEIIKSMNSSELKITFNNNSVIHFRSAENWNKSVVGSGAGLIIFSEYGTYDNDLVYQYASPIIFASGGQMIFISTPRGRNFFYDLWQKAKKWPDWYCEIKTVEDTKHIAPHTMEVIRREHSEEFINQEYYCSFDRGIEGSYWARYVTAMMKENRICRVSYDQSLPVNTAWDLGYHDATVIIFFQVLPNKQINVIDCYADVGQSLIHYAKAVREKPYVYGKHWCPHDSAVHEIGSGLTRIETLRNLGISIETREVQGKLTSAIPRVSLDDGIERVSSTFNRIFIDAEKCSKLIKALESYHREWDQDKSVYLQKPVHDWSSDYADSFRYMCLVADMHQQGMTEEDARRGYNQTINSHQQNFGFPFDNYSRPY